MGRRLTGKQQRSEGFTLIELFVVLAIGLILFAATFINLGRPQQTGNVATVLDELLADIKSQQIVALSGGTGGGASAQPQGVFVQASQFTLFAGSSYVFNANDLVETVPSGVQLSTTLPSG